MTTPADVLSLSLISHTNSGKTTLARTLLRRDVGEVLDQAHVTERSDRFVMLEAGGDPEAPESRIVLWDTPGFGDSARLLRELEGHEDPLAWLAEQTWTREEHLALYSSQQAVQNVVDHADVVLYLVNASEDPAHAGYVDPEMRILGWIGRPVIAILNQSGAPADAEGRRAAEERWRWHLASHEAVRDVISLDAFTRCWVQEGLLLLRLEALVPDAHKPAMTRLLERWRDDNLATLARCAETLAGLLWDAAADVEPLGEGWSGPLARRRATAMLAQRLETATRAATSELIAAYGLEGEAAAFADRELQDVSVPGQRPTPTSAGLVGGAVGGALGGLVADIASAGVSLGGGAIVGAVLGGLGLGGLAWAVDQVAGEADPRVRWSSDYLRRLSEDAIVRYLAVAHFGFGSGAYQQRVAPEFWRPTVAKAVASESRAFERAWREARAGGSTIDAARDNLRHALDRCLRAALIALYPGTERFLGAAGSAGALVAAPALEP